MVNSQVPGVPQAPRSCAGCGGKIADRFLLFSMECYWHTRCLKCSCCQAQLGDIGTTCYSKAGMILCRSDYIRWDGGWGGSEQLLSGFWRPYRLDFCFCVHRLFGHSGACSACGQSIPANEMVMRAQGNVYHLKVKPQLHVIASLTETSGWEERCVIRSDGNSALHLFVSYSSYLCWGFFFNKLKYVCMCVCFCSTLQCFMFVSSPLCINKCLCFLFSVSAVPPVETDWCLVIASITSMAQSSVSMTDPVPPCSTATCLHCRATLCWQTRRWIKSMAGLPAPLSALFLIKLWNAGENGSCSSFIMQQKSSVGKNIYVSIMNY